MGYSTNFGTTQPTDKFIQYLLVSNDDASNFVEVVGLQTDDQNMIISSVNMSDGFAALIDPTSMTYDTDVAALLFKQGITLNEKALADYASDVDFQLTKTTR